MAKSPLNSPFQGDIKPAPSAQDSDCNYLEHTDVSELRQPSDTSVLKEAFYSKGDSLNWSKAALDSPMGTAIPTPSK